MVMGLVVSGCSGTVTGRESGSGGRLSVEEAAPVRLVAFGSCERLVRDLRRAAEDHIARYGWPYGGPFGGGRAKGFGGDVPGDVAGPVPGRAARPEAAAGAPAPVEPVPPAGGGHSVTNVHEAGVDEPDLVKTDGRRIVTVVDGRLRVIDVATRRVRGELALSPDEPGGPAAFGRAELLLHGDRALVIHQRRPLVGTGPVRPGLRAPDGTEGATPLPPRYGARVMLVDLSTGRPRVHGRLNVEGTHVDARQVNGIARVVVRSAPRFVVPPPAPAGAPEAGAQRLRRAVGASPVQAWLPQYEVERDGRRQGRTVPCERLRHPPVFSGMSMLSVFTIPLAAPMGDGDPVTVVADGDTVYGTASSLYVASNPTWWAMWRPGRSVGPARPDAARPDVTAPDAAPPAAPAAGSTATEIHRFDIGRPGPPQYAASGRVPGRLLNQYALSEHQGRLRVATTTDPVIGMARGRSSSAVYVLGQRGGRLVTEGRVDGLGKGERIYAVRFLGGLGYVVTFRRTDPLYVIDLRDPARPRVRGELKITGYSAYLHPAGAGRLIGVGQEATAEGRVLGGQVSLFDVSDPDRPRRFDAYHLPGSGSEVESDPHAFLYWPQSGLTVLPVHRAPTGPPAGARGGDAAALVLKTGPERVERVGEVRHRRSGPSAGRAPIRRALLTGSTLWTVSRAGVLASDAAALTTQAWIAFD